MNRSLVLLAFSILLLVPSLGCKKHSGVQKPVELKKYAIDGTEKPITQSGVEFDKGTSSDGNGSLMYKADKPATFRLFETGDLDLEDCTLIYSARVRTKDVEGKAFLEMWLTFKGMGEFFSRGLATAISGTNEWTTIQTPFYLQKGQNPDNVKLNFVIDGKGTAWVDDIILTKGPLK